MSETLTFELASPERLLFSQPVAMVAVPGGEGDYGVLPGHAPMITTVKAGVIDVYAVENAAPSTRIFVAGGFAEVTQDRCTVLADEAVPVADLNLAELQGAARQLADKIAASADAERDALVSQKALVDAKIQAIAA